MTEAETRATVSIQADDGVDFHIDIQSDSRICLRIEDPDGEVDQTVQLMQVDAAALASLFSRAAGLGKILESMDTPLVRIPDIYQTPAVGSS